MELFIVARFHAREGVEAEAGAVLQAQVSRTRAEPGCLEIGAYRSARDPRLFWIVSRWTDEAAFEIHAGLENTERFVARMQALIDHPFDAARATRIG
ncbi:MAG: antibiotic biosynthesis monooxygenase [Alphaproteobacteria bacterium]|nr:antibiotic biosynthesis monooxygenase [Alphaproteobacteria bacterium]MDE2112146.1 antibiotic biosynthesis monooxygenase [Alphaproteobacteria bacterium]MDE2495777.1 antibiotic biosynthesis monooxygenase [Alphaproteobacteria bacterium]